MGLLATFNILLMRYCGSEDILVGLPTTNRNHNSLSETIGVFINTVIVRADLSGRPTFRDLLTRIRVTIWTRWRTRKRRFNVSRALSA